MKLRVNNTDYAKLCQASCQVFGFFLRKRFEVLKGKNKHFVGLSEIDADKTMRFLDKIWGNRLVNVNEETAKKYPLSYFPVERDFDDKHGHRIAFPSGKDTRVKLREGMKPVLNVMRAFNKRGLPSNATFVDYGVSQLWGKVKLIVPQVSAGALHSIIEKKYIHKFDITFLENLGAVCGELNEEEMIAIGRHENADSTRKSLVWELWRWSEWTKDAFRVLLKYGNSGTSMQNLGLAKC